MLGRNLSRQPLIERSRIQRQLPKKTHILAQPFTLIIISGLIQFLPSIVFYKETFESFWGTQIFADYRLMLLQSLLLLMTVATIGMTCVYLILQSENHQWWKPTFSIGGALSTYTFCFSVLFFLGQLLQPNQEGGFEFTIRLVIGYLSYNMLIGWGLYVMFGSVGFLSSFYFMRFLYSKVRLD